MCIQRCPVENQTGIYLYDPDHVTLRYDLDEYFGYKATIFKPYCIPAIGIPGRSEVLGYINKPMEFAKRVAGDFSISYDIMIIGYLVSVFVGLIFMLLFRISNLMPFAIYGSTAIAVVLLVFLAILCQNEQDRIDNLLCGNDSKNCENYNLNYLPEIVLYICAVANGCLVVLQVLILK